MIALPSYTLERFLDEVYVPHHLGIRDGTVEQYRITIRLLNQFAGRVLTTRELTESLAVEFRSALLKGELGDGRNCKTRSPATVNSKWAGLRSLWRFAHARLLAQDCPSLSKVREPKRKPRAYSLEQMERLIEACYAARPRRGWEGVHWVALVLVIYDTGLRIRTMLSLRRSQLILPARLLRAEPEQVKDDEELAFRLHEQTIGAVAEILHGSDLIFPWPFHKRTIWHHFEPILERAGIEPDSSGSHRRNKFHKIRRTSASWLESVRPGAATPHLGHGERSTTVKSYIDPEIAGTQVYAADYLPRFTVRQADPQRALFDRFAG